MPLSISARSEDLTVSSVSVGLWVPASDVQKLRVHIVAVVDRWLLAWYIDLNILGHNVAASLSGC